ncbi:YggT family protein [Aerococcaceae bacterium DSM 111022]|nr:YggT family protein [Aerococcaceae bacterium DSM 111022]
MFLYTIIRLINTAFDAYSLLLVLYALLSWFPTAQGSKLGEIVNKLVRPYLQFFERFRFGPVGFSVIIGLLVLRLAQQGLNNILFWLFF